MYKAVTFSVFLTAFMLSGLSLSVVPAYGAGSEELEKRIERLEREFALSKQRDVIAMGREIYKSACMTCHGINGDGNGSGAKWLNPKPRDFTTGLFKWRVTPYGALPTDEDLERSIRQGVSGTEMFPFKEILSKNGRMAVAQYIKIFSPRFADPAEMTAPEKILKIPETRPFESSDESIEKGKKLFAAKGCIACHGLEGGGDGPAADSLIDGWGQPIPPWDFSRGYFKSGPTDQDLYRTISTGLNGTPMISFAAATTEEERWNLVDYIQSIGGEQRGIFHYLFIEEPGGRHYE